MSWTFSCFIIILQIWNTATDCNITRHSWLMKKCNETVIQSDPKFFMTLNDCYPLFKVTFPRCWDSLYHFLYKNNTFVYEPEDNKCRLSCLETYRTCSMLNLFTLSQTCINLQKIQDLCDGLGRKPCSLKKIPGNSGNVCDGALVSTTEESHWLIRWSEKDMNNVNTYNGCSLKCNNEIQVFQAGQMHVDGPILILSSISMLATIFTVMSFLIDWKCQNRYPAIILFILNVCFLLCLLGLVIQFFGVGAKISCNEKKQKRSKEPRSLDSIWCIISFILIYFSSMAVACWFVVLNYAWYISFRTMGSIRVIIQDKVKYFHLFSWSIATVLTLMALLLQVVDAHPITNICYVMPRDKTVRDGLVSFPFTVAIMLGEGLLIQSVRELRKLRENCNVFLIPKAVQNITRTIYRLVIYGFSTAFSFGLFTFSIYDEVRTSDDWNKVNSEYIRCSIEKRYFQPPLSFSLPRTCVPPDNSRLLYLHTQILALFIFCVTTSSWTWTRGTLRIWTKVWKKHFLENKVDERLCLERSWYKRMNNKKISPFIPPVDPQNPLDEGNFHFVRKDKRFSLPEEILEINRRSRRNSDDIRSVVELFSIRRNTIGSLQSVRSSEFHTGRVNKSASIQSFGHLSIARDMVPLRRTTSNLTLIRVHDNNRTAGLDKRRQSNVTLDELQQIRDKLYTPLTTVHRDNIVADCIPYTRDAVDYDLISSAIELRDNLRTRQKTLDLFEAISLSSTKI